jgi:hypothetical protein
MRLSQKNRILKLLLTGKKIHMRTLNNIAFCYSQRISELRQQGYKIDAIRLKGSEYAYQLTA